GMEFHFAGFAIHTKLVLYRPPGIRVAYLMIGMNLNESGDSLGKNTPSATPEDRSSYDSGAGLRIGTAPIAFATSVMTPPPRRIFSPSKSLSVLIACFTLKISPGPWVNTPSTTT